MFHGFDLQYCGLNVYSQIKNTWIKVEAPMASLVGGGGSLTSDVSFIVSELEFEEVGFVSTSKLRV